MATKMISKFPLDEEVIKAIDQQVNAAITITRTDWIRSALLEKLDRDKPGWRGKR